MPIYDFRCNKCKTTFSVSTSFSSMIGCEMICPCCHSEDVEKLFKNFNVIFKGKGFYTTDTKKDEDKTPS